VIKTTTSALILAGLTLASTSVFSASTQPVKLPPAKSIAKQPIQPAQTQAKKPQPPLKHLKIQGKTINQLASKLENLEYDIIESSITARSFEVVVDDQQFGYLSKLKGFDIDLLATGKPFSQSPEAMARDAVDVNSTKLAPPSGYKNLAQVMQELNAIAALNPSIAKVVDITATYNQPSTLGGRHMYAIKISDNVNANEDEPPILVVSNHHVRELVTPVIALNAARNLVQQYGNNADVTRAVNDNEIWIAANWNPDGYVHVFEVDNMWRKNRRVMSNGVGVDLNRNYPVGWDTSCSGSTTHSSQTYKGPSAGSEVETQTMMAWANDRRFTKVIDFHSSGREVLWDYHPSCATHPFDDHQKEEGKVISADAGYDRWRSATALGENFQWHLKKGANAYLVETHSSFQPTYASAQTEAQQLWPALLNYFNRPIPVVGHVTDQQGNPLIDVDVRVLNKNYPFGDDNLTASNGRYQVHVPDGSYSLRFSKPGYTSVTKTVAVNSGNTQNLDVSLSTGPIDEVTVLENDLPMTNLAGAQTDQTLFKLAVPNDATTLSFNLSGGTGDADLYVRKGQKPTQDIYDCRPYIGGNNETCDMDVSQGDWYVMLVGYSQYSGVTLVGSFTTTPTGGNDTLNVTDLTAATGEQLNYEVDVPVGRSKVNVTLSGGSGDADLYVKYNSAPSTSNYDCRSWSYGNTESCSVNRTGDKAYILIHAYASFNGADLAASSN